MSLQAQTIIEGIVKDIKSKAVFAANVYPKNSGKGAITDFEGKFNLVVNTDFDSLLVSFIGYQTQIIALENIDLSKPLIIYLKENEALLSEVIVKGKNIIAEEFSVIEISKIEIYTNPIAAADPLKAITILPSSTNTGETANPELRGSSAGRSGVILMAYPLTILYAVHSLMV